ncbi:MAG: DUF58 domain-containing protein [Agarilytica sp.]
MFLLFVLVLWLLGTNYQNNLILALTFLLISIFIVSILHTFSNLAGLDIELKGAGNAFVGENVHFTITVNNSSTRASNGVSMCWQGSELSSSDFDCEEKSSLSVHVDMLAKRRGHINPKRLLVECEYPLGLLRCWTWLKFDAHALVYPAPIKVDLVNSSVEDDDGDGEHPVKGGEDFSAFREYQPGDPIKHIAWKLYARERGLYTKEFSHNISREIWLDFFQVQSQDVELTLSALCYWALEFSQRDENFGLVLPGIKIAPNKGENHKARTLEALAKFEAY